MSKLGQVVIPTRCVTRKFENTAQQNGYYAASFFRRRRHPKTLVLTRHDPNKTKKRRRTTKLAKLITQLAELGTEYSIQSNSQLTYIYIMLANVVYYTKKKRSVLHFLTLLCTRSQLAQTCPRRRTSSYVSAYNDAVSMK